MSDTWIPIADYSIKHKVSISTLRRRIKGNDIHFRFEDGKYLILDAPLTETVTRAHRPSLNSENVQEQSVNFQSVSLPDLQFSEPAPTFASEPLTTSPAPAKVHLPFLQAEQARHQLGNEVAQQLLAEIKKAYALILAEKEEQILQLKEEVNDLKTLTRILESELARARNHDR